MGSVLILDSVDAYYGKTQALFGISLQLRPGTITTLLGANGAGKTTTLRAISRTIRTRGNISFAGSSLTRMRTEKTARMGLTHVPDGRGTFSALTVEENLWLGAYTRNNSNEVRTDIEQAYERFPKLGERRYQQAGTLSGGEQQMLAISRALMLRPKVMLLDEPSFGLAPLVVAEIFKVITDIVQDGGVSVLLVEQNANLALGVSKYAYVIESGAIILEGSSAEISKNDGVRKAYLGN